MGNHFDDHEHCSLFFFNCLAFSRLKGSVMRSLDRALMMMMIIMMIQKDMICFDEIICSLFLFTD